MFCLMVEHSLSFGAAFSVRKWETVIKFALVTMAEDAS